MLAQNSITLGVGGVTNDTVPLYAMISDDLGAEATYLFSVNVTAAPKSVDTNLLVAQVNQNIANGDKQSVPILTAGCVSLLNRENNVANISTKQQTRASLLSSIHNIIESNTTALTSSEVVEIPAVMLSAVTDLGSSGDPEELDANTHDLAVTLTARITKNALNTFKPEVVFASLTAETNVLASSESSVIADCH